MPKRNRVTNDSGHKRIQKRAIPLLLSCITTFPLFSVQSSANSGIDVYPPNWWVGMQNSNVELMLYGDDVADDTVSIAKGDVSVKHSQALDSENYLFVTLDTSNVSAQELVIRLTDSDGTTRDLTYTLEKRAQGSASREGFGPQDAIYLIAPDRYANGNKENDNVKGYGDPADRSFKGGRHGGDIQGIVDNLNYIQDMGFTQIWTMPMLEKCHG